MKDAVTQPLSTESKFKAFWPFRVKGGALSHIAHLVTAEWARGNNLSSRVVWSSGRTASAPATGGGPSSPGESAGSATACSSDGFSISAGRKKYRVGLADSTSEGTALPATKLTPGRGWRPSRPAPPLPPWSAVVSAPRLRPLRQVLWLSLLLLSFLSWLCWWKSLLTTSKKVRRTLINRQF